MDYFVEHLEHGPYNLIVENSGNEFKIKLYTHLENSVLTQQMFFKHLTEFLQDYSVFKNIKIIPTDFKFNLITDPENTFKNIEKIVGSYIDISIPGVQKEVKSIYKDFYLYSTVDIRLNYLINYYDNIYDFLHETSKNNFYEIGFKIINNDFSDKSIFKI